MIKCAECGYENMDGLDYCDGCGAKLGTSAAEAAPAENVGIAAPASEAAAGAGSGAGEQITPVEGSSGVSSADAAAAAPAAPEPSKAPTGEMQAPAAQPAAAAGAPIKAKLSIIRGGRRGQEFELEAGNNLVGRWDPDTGSFPEVDLDADDPEAKISRKHALIRIEGPSITIEDIGSLNGTFVNRQPRLQPGTPVQLKDGDEVIIGKTFLKLNVSPIS